MNAKRFLSVSGLGIGIAALIFCITAFERISDAACAFTPDIPAGLHWTTVPLALMQSGVLAVRCIGEEYSVEMKTALAPLVYKYNPVRARMLANEALSQTAAGDSPQLRYDALVALASISRKDKNYSAAQNYLQAALHPGGKEWIPLQDQGMAATLELAELAKDQKQFQKSEQYYDELLQSEYTRFTDGCMQEAVQYLLAKKAELEEEQGRVTEARSLRHRIDAISAAISAHRISDEEAPFINAARTLSAKQESSAPPEEQQVPDAKPKAPSKELVAELRALRFPGIGLIPDGPKTVGNQEDGIRYESCNVREEVVPFTPYGPLDPPVDIPFGMNGCYVALDGGNYYSFSAQYEQVTLAKNGKIERFEVKTPQVCWGCKGLVIDEPSGTMLAISDEGVNPVLFVSARSKGQWEPVADLKVQGVENPCGMFFTKEHKLYLFDRDRDQRITALVRLSTDGTVLRRTNFQSPIPLQDEFNFGIVPFGDKVAIIEPQGQFTAKNGDTATGGAWIVNFKGDVLANICFDQHEDDGIESQEVSLQPAGAP